MQVFINPTVGPQHVEAALRVLSRYGAVTVDSRSLVAEVQVTTQVDYDLVASLKAVLEVR